MRFFPLVLRRNEQFEQSLDFDFDFADITPKEYLKQIVLETNVNFLARTISMTEFRIMKDNKRIRDEWDYILNVRPNLDQSAAEFWHTVAYKLIYDNEVLVVASDDNQLLIVDSFERVERAVYEDSFKNVTVKDFIFARTFPMSEVIYLTYNNDNLTRLLNQVFSDYADLFTRMFEIQKLNNQIRGTVEMDSTQTLTEENQKRLQAFIDKLFASFRKSAIALVPKLKGFDYKEVSSGDNDGKSVEELAKLKRDLVDDVANILGIPTSLVHGDMAEYETAIKAYIKFCISPLLKKIQDELNVKIIEKEEYQQGKAIQARGIAELNPLELATAVDKLRASGVYNGNEIRVKLGDEPVDEPALDEYVLTKNYERATKGGEEGNEKND